MQKHLGMEASNGSSQELRPLEDRELEGRELYERIVDSDRFGNPQESEGDKIPIRIIGDQTIDLSNHAIHLTSHKLFVFNALVITRRALTKAELRTLGFDNSAHEERLTYALSSLSAKLKEATNLDIIRKEGQTRSRKFVLHPNVVLIDNRSDSERASDLDSKEINKQRDRAAKIILKHYGDHPRVTRVINSLIVQPMSTDHIKNECDLYISFANQFKLLDAAEEVALAQTLEAGFTAYLSRGNLDNLSKKEERIMIDFTVAHRRMQYSNLKLVAFTAKKVKRKQLTTMELINEGNTGLVAAINRFDYTRGNKFSTYAMNWIWQSMSKAIADQDSTIKLPRHIKQFSSRIAKTVQELTTTLGRSPTSQQIAQRSGLPLEQVNAFLNHDKPLFSLDASVDNDGATLGHFLSDASAETDRIVEQASAWAQVNELFKHHLLDDREILVLSLHAGAFERIPGTLQIEGPDGKLIDYAAHIDKIRGTDPLTFTAIGKILKLTPGRIGQIHKEGLEKARKVLAED